MQPCGWVGPVGIYGHNMCMLEPRQGLRLGRCSSVDLECDGPIGQMLLLGQVNSSECSSPELFHQTETGDGLAGIREQGPCLARSLRPVGGSTANQLVDCHDFLKRAGEPGKPG